METLNPDQIPFALAEIWTKRYQHVVAGINEDDCFIMEGDGSNIVISSDFLNASPIAVELGIADNFDLGRLLVASNISDLCGSGAKPMAMMICTMVERNTTKESYLRLIEGIKFELDKIDIPLVGGDTKFGKSNALLGIAIGIKEKESDLFLKNGAQPDELIWVSGALGAVSSAVDGFSNFKEKLTFDWLSWAKEKLIDPKLPLEKSRAVAKMRIGRGGTDISDGLGADLRDLCKASRVGCIIHADRIPIDNRVKQISEIRELPDWCYSLILGGDFQFIVTTDKKHEALMEKEGFKQIGKTTSSKDLRIITNSLSYDLPLHGHEDGRNLSFGSEVDFLANNLKLHFR